MKFSHLHIVIGFLAALLGGIGLGYYFGYDIGWENALQGDGMGIANPASTHCVEIGGTLEIVDGAEGQSGLCHLPDGRVCEEWALFRDGSCTLPE